MLYQLSYRPIASGVENAEDTSIFPGGLQALFFGNPANPVFVCKAGRFLAESDLSVRVCAPGAPPAPRRARANKHSQP